MTTNQDSERKRVLKERAQGIEEGGRRMEEDGAPYRQLPAHDEAEEGGDEVADKSEKDEEE